VIPVLRALKHSLYSQISVFTLYTVRLTH